MSDPSTPFPTLFLDAPEASRWPAPPFAWPHRAAPDNDMVQPCRIETAAGTLVEGEMLGFDPAGRTLTFRTSAGGPPVELAFARFRRLTLTTPLQPEARIVGMPAERVPAAAQEREYRLQSAAGTAPPLTGQSAGHVETVDGMYLFPPTHDESSLLRVFVPRSAYARCEFGASAEETAAARWIASPHELLAAIERQQRMPVLPLGNSLLALGLLTKHQLDRALAHPSPTLPLGEALVAAGVIARADLQTALAHKMGYPMVDLARFPIDPAAVTRLPLRFATGYRAVPLMLDGERLIVAVDKPARANKLRSVHAFAELSMVAVLASKMQIVATLERLKSDVWTHHVADRVPFFATTL